MVDMVIEELTGPQIRREVIQLGWADEARFDNATEALKRWAESPDCFMAHASCEVIAHKR
jgi:hypothetical protein